MKGLLLSDMEPKIRASIGTAAVLGLAKCRMDAPPTTAYLMTYTEGRCSANCSFCPQARESVADLSLLSRVEWPAYPSRRVLEALAKRGSSFSRVCLQTLNYPGFADEVVYILGETSRIAQTPRSLCTPPLPTKRLEHLLRLGVDRVCFALDAATLTVFSEVKGRGAGGPYQWERHWEALREALKVFGPGRVTTHLIVGLGETEEEMLTTIQRLADMGVLPSLFALTPVSGTKMAAHQAPSVASYRRLQLGRHLIVSGFSRVDDMTFNERGVLKSLGVREEVFVKVVDGGAPFQTSGCPGCNRPFYNEAPRGPIYNYPRRLTEEEVEEAVSVSEVKP